MIELILDKVSIGTLNRMSEINKYYNKIVNNHFKTIFNRQILSNINFQNYINNYHVCYNCNSIKTVINYLLDPPLCSKCVKNIDQCVRCGIYRNVDEFMIGSYDFEKEIGEYPICRDGCIFICSLCKKECNDMCEVKKILPYKNIIICVYCHNELFCK